MSGRWGWEADMCLPMVEGGLMMSTGSQDTISNEQRQEIDNDGFISFLYHLSLNPLAPAPAMPADTMAKLLNTGAWNGTLLSPF